MAVGPIAVARKLVGFDSVTSACEQQTCDMQGSPSLTWAPPSAWQISPPLYPGPWHIVTVCLLSSLFIGLVLPETKGKTLPAIAREYDKLNFRGQERRCSVTSQAQYQLGESVCQVANTGYSLAYVSNDDCL
ncbi:hypothetical protein JZ751_001277 [Albula glossodonta]|uniref:Uncharacterized protein n=1 Tax=Albula glossodonta TaxID=121402 RepID=A0A8T2PT92_9TELE|nr:hypothetical protein JZ751_001277 [Albula glossodonta]